MPDERRLAGVLLVAVSGIVLTAVQPQGRRSAAVYFVVIIAAMRLPCWPAAAPSARSRSAARSWPPPSSSTSPGDKISGLLFSIVRGSWSSG